MTDKVERPQYTAEQVLAILPKLGVRARLSIFAHTAGGFRTLDPADDKKHGRPNGSIHSAQQIHFSEGDPSGVGVLVTTTFTLYVKTPIEEKDRVEPELDSMGYIVRSTYEVMFDFPDATNAEIPELGVFGQVSAILTAWPHWREYVSNSFARLGVMGPPLYLLTPSDAIRMASFKNAPPPSSEPEPIAKPT